MSLALSEISCGVRQLMDLDQNSPEELVAQVKRRDVYYYSEIDTGLGDTDIGGAFYVFSDKASSKHCERLIRYIRYHKLGTVRSSSPKINPNSQNVIKVHIWEVDWNAVEAWNPTKEVKREFLDAEDPFNLDYDEDEEVPVWRWG